MAGMYALLQDQGRGGGDAGPLGDLLPEDAQDAQNAAVVRLGEHHHRAEALPAPFRPGSAYGYSGTACAYGQWVLSQSGSFLEAGKPPRL